MKNYHRYNFRSGVLDVIDISVPQKNYFVKYSNDAIKNQRIFFSELGIEEYFDSRVVVANSFGTNIIRIEDISHSSYNGNKSNCNGYEGVFTSIPKLPLFTGFGDCPQLMVVGDKDIGLVHATRDTLDNYILQTFFEKFAENNNLAITQIGFSPYIFPEDFMHHKINLKRTDWCEAVRFDKGSYFLDLKKMILNDLESIGIDKSNIKDLSMNTYRLSEQSEQLGGYQISHRQASTKEGRGGLVLMIR